AGRLRPLELVPDVLARVLEAAERERGLRGGPPPRAVAEVGEAGLRGGSGRERRLVRLCVAFLRALQLGEREQPVLRDRVGRALELALLDQAARVQRRGGTRVLLPSVAACVPRELEVCERGVDVATPELWLRAQDRRGRERQRRTPLARVRCRRLGRRERALEVAGEAERTRDEDPRRPVRGRVLEQAPVVPGL